MEGEGLPSGSRRVLAQTAVLMGLGYFQDTNSFPHNYAKELFIVLPDLRSHTRRDIIKHFELAVSIMRPVGKAYDYLPRHLLSTKLPNKIIRFFKYVSTSFSTHNFPRSPGLIRCLTIE